MVTIKRDPRGVVYIYILTFLCLLYIQNNKGNSLNESNTRLKRVTLICDDKQGDRITREVWSGDDALLKVSAIQQDLGKIEQDLPATFWFR